LRIKDPEDCTKLIKSLAYLHNFLLDHKEPNDLPVGAEEVLEEDRENGEDEEGNMGEPQINNRLRFLVDRFKEANNIH
jgi:hypothetical protein